MTSQLHIDVSPKRCPICDWSMAESAEKGCVPGNCSYRPAHGSEEWQRIQRRKAWLIASSLPRISLGYLKIKLDNLRSESRTPEAAAFNQALDAVQSILDDHESYEVRHPEPTASLSTQKLAMIVRRLRAVPKLPEQGVCTFFSENDIRSLEQALPPVDLTADEDHPHGRTNDDIRSEHETHFQEREDGGLLKPASNKGPRTCHCKPGRCDAPHANWCVDTEKASAHLASGVV